MPSPFWRFELFGGFRAFRIVTAQDTTNESLEPVALPSLRKACGLLALLLAIGPGESSPREELTEQLWPGDEPVAARDRFKQTLAVLRRFLEPVGSTIPSGSVLSSDRFQAGLHRDSVSSDISEFKAALRFSGERRLRETPEIALESLERAVSLCRGEFAPGYYEDLLLAERTRLAEQHLNALLRLSKALPENGRAEEALIYARSAIVLDPLREEGHVSLLQILSGMGRNGEAVRQYRVMEEMLRAELGAAPSAAMRRLLETLTNPKDIEPIAAPTILTPAGTVKKIAPLPAAPPTRFFGRESEIADLLTLLEPEEQEASATVITLIGLGGSGKTRLVLELAASAVASGRSVVFVPLASVNDPERIVERIAESIAAILPRNEPVIPALARALIAHSPATLLILDNFEQLVENGAIHIAALLHELRTLGSGISLVITTQRRLNIQGEQLFRVEPLPTPHAPGTPERLREFPSIQLFVDRAQSVRPSFALTSANSSDIVELCRRLDGLPLAIELAAAWASVLTPAQILQRINRRFDLLVSHQPDTPERHRSLRAAIGAGIPLLPPELRRLFARLSVFRGGWTLEAAESVCVESNDYRDQMPQQLLALQRQSLIVAETSDRGADGAIRYKMLESLREYAGEMLAAENPSETRCRHADYLIRFVRAKQSQLYTADNQPLLLQEMDDEMDNVRAAQSFYLESSDILNSLLLSMGLWRYCEIRGNLSLGIELIEAALQLADSVSDALSDEIRFARAGALNSLGVLVSDIGDQERCERLWEASIVGYRSLGKTLEALRPMSNLATLSVEQGDYPTGIKRLEEILAFQRQQNDRTGMAYTLTNLGSAVMGTGDYTRAFACYEESLLLKRVHGNRLSMALTLSGLSQTAFHSGRFGLARAYAEEGLNIYHESGDRYRICDCLTALACVAREERDYLAAARHFTLILQYQWESGRLRYALTTVECLADVSLRAGSADVGARLWSAADSMRARHSLIREPSTMQILDAVSVEASLREALPPDDFAREWTMGLMLTDEQVFRQACAVANSENIFAKVFKIV